MGRVVRHAQGVAEMSAAPLLFRVAELRLRSVADVLRGLVPCHEGVPELSAAPVALSDAQSVASTKREEPRIIRGAFCFRFCLLSQTDPA